METLIYIVCLYVFFGFANVAFSESENSWRHKLTFWPAYLYEYIRSKFQ